MKTTLSFPPCGTNIPYFDANEFNPSERHEYVDLRLNPADVDELPELKAAPLFKDLLLQINGAQSIFRTFGCNFDFLPAEEQVIGPPIPPSDEPQVQILPAGADSYVHVGFSDLARCTQLDDYYRLAGRLAKHLHEQSEFAEQDDTEYHSVELGIETLIMDSENKGFVLALYCSTLGLSEDEAKNRWARLMTVITSFLSNEKLD